MKIAFALILTLTLAGCRCLKSVERQQTRQESSCVECYESKTASELRRNVTEVETIVMTADSVGDLRVVSHEKTITKVTEETNAAATQEAVVESSSEETINETDNEDTRDESRSNWKIALAIAIVELSAILLLLCKKN